MAKSWKVRNFSHQVEDQNQKRHKLNKIGRLYMKSMDPSYSLETTIPLLVTLVKS